ncbi:GntR family transcriptional regulator [Citrobacter koseri]|nr:GntR family transcriptional regulator [Citrobacter koseri]
MKACWLMTNSQNPLGFTLSPEKKARLVALLDQYNIVLIEDDVYSELYFGRDKPLPAKAWDRHDKILHCSSFSKCLVPRFSYRLGCSGKVRQTNSAATADEYAIHQFTNAACSGRLPFDTPL